MAGEEDITGGTGELDTTGADAGLEPVETPETDAGTAGVDAGTDADVDPAITDEAGEGDEAVQDAGSGTEFPSDLIDRLSKMLDGAEGVKPAGEPAAGPAAGSAASQTPKAPEGAAKPAQGAELPADIAAVVAQSIAAADEYMGEGAGKTVIKPLADTIAKLTTELATLKAELSPVKQFHSQAEKAAQAAAAKQTETAARKFFDKHADFYGGKFDDLLKDPAKRERGAKLFERAHQVQTLVQQLQGEPISDEDALALAHAINTRQQTESQALQQIKNQLRGRTAQRTAPSRAASGSRPVPREPETHDEILAATRKFWPTGDN